MRYTDWKPSCRHYVSIGTKEQLSPHALRRLNCSLFYLIGLRKHVQYLIGLRELINSYRLSSASANLKFISISILLFSSIGMISAARMHLYLALLFPRDYFARPDASLSGSFVPQGLFRPAGCISIGLFCSTGITLPRSDASLSGSFAPQGLFRQAECISIGLFCSTRIISPS